jgi:hypothetical protein
VDIYKEKSAIYGELAPIVRAIPHIRLEGKVSMRIAEPDTVINGSNATQGRNSAVLKINLGNKCVVMSGLKPQILTVRIVPPTTNYHTHSGVTNANKVVIAAIAQYEASHWQGMERMHNESIAIRPVLTQNGVGCRTDRFRHFVRNFNEALVARPHDCHRSDVCTIVVRAAARVYEMPRHVPRSSTPA